MRLKPAKLLLIGIIILGFILRTVFIDFPFLDTEEARISYRGYSLVNFGVDELGRSNLLIFNSSDGYSLPLVSYLSGVGIKIFGRNDFGARIPYIVTGLLLIYIVFLTGVKFGGNLTGLLGAFVVATSPMAIYNSRVPNEGIVLSVFILSIFLIFISKEVNYRLLILIIILGFMSSVWFWFLCLPVVVFNMVYVRRVLSLSGTTKEKIGVILFVFGITTVSFLSYMQLGNGYTHLVEYFWARGESSFVTSSINVLRSQGITEGWPKLLVIGFFNKSHIILWGLLNWISNISLDRYFGSLGPRGVVNFPYLGVFSIVTIVPFFVGLAALGVKRTKLLVVLLVNVLIATYPSIFNFSSRGELFLLFSLGFMALIIAIGLETIKSGYRWVVVWMILMSALSLFTNVRFFTTTSERDRPIWLRGLINEIEKVEGGILVSDNIVDDLGINLKWYTDKYSGKNKEVTEGYPYRYRIQKVGNVSLILSETLIQDCGARTGTKAIISERDKQKLLENYLKSGQWVEIKGKEYKDSMNNIKAIMPEVDVCLGAE